MKIHEYQAKSVLARFGVPVPRGEVAFSAAEAGEIARRLGGDIVVVKAQIHAGGRGKGGGVKVARSAGEAEQLAKQMIGMTLVTHQTGPEGQEGRPGADRGGAADRAGAVPEHPDRPCGGAPRRSSRSAAGGMDIEEVAAQEPREDPSRAHRSRAPASFRSRRGSSRSAWGSPAAAGRKFVKLLESVYKAFVDTDASMIEINPLILTKGGDLLALDAKVTFDDNALYRHPDLRELRDISEEDPLEVEASKFSLNYIRLDGNIGCMVNGAGLAMATMDIIKLAGGEPANFLDVGGGANAEQIKNAFRILMADKNVKAVLINIFGGILRCDVLAAGGHRGGQGARRARADRHPDGRHQRRGRQADAAGERLELHDRRFDGRSGREGRRAGWRQGRGLGPSGSSSRQNTRLIVQGLTGREGTFHAKAAAAYGTHGRRRRHARQGRHDARGLAGLQQRARRRARDRRERHVIFVPPPFAADAIMEAADAGFRWRSASPKASRSSTC